ncbi:polar amino acid transport system permease protein [Mesorhizobium soli]|uniref:amino acid ABC transporter permease n=1 Tax=Pseudaminobacter soli (ex Li et al. 2025) TaxID=1295366 RepID=UPI0024760112|nr:amino acid ABC transporter permease [Mesorhizobium soli]MDH6232233.1 polar amino acid transport system permease protein [Mesorhizobium soli]
MIKNVVPIPKPTLVAEASLDPIPFDVGMALPIASLAFPPTGIPAVLFALRAKAASDDRKQMLRYAMRSRLWAQYSFGSLFAVAVVGFVVAALIANNYAVADGYFNWEVLVAGFPQIVKAFATNIWVSVAAEIAAVAWGLTLAVARSLPGRAAAPIRLMAIFYIDLFRGLPSLLTILIIGFGLPQTGLPIVSNLSLFTSGALALTIVYGAYLAETFRAGIEGVHWSQVAAGRAIGLTYFQVMRFVVLPQALRNVIPPLLNWYISLLKDTSLLSVLGLLEGVTTARILVTAQSNLSALTGVSLCFLAVTIPLARFTDHLIKRNAAKLRGVG